MFPSDIELNYLNNRDIPGVYPVHCTSPSMHSFNTVMFYYFTSIKIQITAVTYVLGLCRLFFCYAVGTEDSLAWPPEKSRNCISFSLTEGGRFDPRGRLAPPYSIYIYIYVYIYIHSCNSYADGYGWINLTDLVRRMELLPMSYPISVKLLPLKGTAADALVWLEKFHDETTALARVKLWK